MAWSKLSRQERGYGAAWDRIRKRVMERDCGLCQVCAREGRVALAHAVDHIVSKANATRMKWTPEQMDAEANLQAICGPCHLAKSAEDEGKTLRPKVRIGLDGFPIE